VRGRGRLEGGQELDARTIQQVRHHLRIAAPVRGQDDEPLSLTCPPVRSEQGVAGAREPVEQVACQVHRAPQGIGVAMPDLLVGVRRQESLGRPQTQAVPQGVVDEELAQEGYDFGQRVGRPLGHDRLHQRLPKVDGQPRA
jgi:hypothetical protein